MENFTMSRLSCKKAKKADSQTEYRRSLLIRAKKGDKKAIKELYEVFKCRIVEVGHL